MMILPKVFSRLEGSSFSFRVLPIASAILLVATLVSPLSAELIYGIANQSPATALLTWDSASPGTILSGVFISGMDAGESILAIDARPVNGIIAALSSKSRTFNINTTTGAISSGPPTPFGPPALSGFSFGYDFNPVTGHVQIVSETNQNLDLVTPTGLTVLPSVAYALGDPNFGIDPNVVDLAFTNNFAGAASTTLYGIDTGLDVLVTQNLVTGVLTTVGSLGLDVSAAGGFDISSATGIAYAALLSASASQSSLYTINLATGAATNLGSIDGGVVITAMTVNLIPVPEPSSVLLLLAGVFAASAACRRR